MDREDVAERINRLPRARPQRANARRLGQILYQPNKPPELPPWVVIRDRVVMRWRDWHHVADIGDDDPFEVAQRLFRRLQARSGRA